MAKKYNGATLENGLYYTDDEIYTLYRDAPDKLEQLKILTELNLCEVDNIINALKRKGLKKSSNGLYFDDEELLALYTKYNGYDKRIFINKIAQIHKCTVKDIQNKLLHAGVNSDNNRNKINMTEK